MKQIKRTNCTVENMIKILEFDPCYGGINIVYQDKDGNFAANYRSSGLRYITDELFNKLKDAHQKRNIRGCSDCPLLDFEELDCKSKIDLSIDKDGKCVTGEYAKDERYNRYLINLYAEIEGSSIKSHKKMYKVEKEICADSLYIDCKNKRIYCSPCWEQDWSDKQYIGIWIFDIVKQDFTERLKVPFDVTYEANNDMYQFISKMQTFLDLYLEDE